MGMSIDEQIKRLEYLKKCGIFPFADTKTGIFFTDECIDGAIDTMRKYQKIAEIVTNNELEWGNTSVRANALLEVKKVVEDGNDN